MRTAEAPDVRIVRASQDATPAQIAIAWLQSRRSAPPPTRTTDATALNRREIDLAGDVRTMPEAAEILTEALGRPIAFAQTPIKPVRRGGYTADIAGLEREFGRPLTKLPDWARGQTAGMMTA